MSDQTARFTASSPVSAADKDHPHHHKPGWLKRNAPAIETSVTFGLPAVAVLLANGIVHCRDFIDGIAASDPPRTTALVTALLAGSVGAFAMRHHKTTARQEERLDKLLATQERTDRDVRRVSEKITGVDDANRRKDARSDALAHEVDRLKEQIASGAHEEPDVDALWANICPGTRMTSVQPMWNQELTIIRTPNGPKFAATARIREVLFPRVEEGTALSEWWIVVRVSSFSSHGMLAVHKLLFIEQELRDIAKREGRRERIDSVIRVSVHRDGPDDLESSFCFVKDSVGGRTDVTVKYYRHPASNANLSQNGTLYRCHGEGDRRLYQEKAKELFFSGIQMTFAELREAVEHGRWPEEPDSIVCNGDHMSFGKRRSITL